MSGVTTPTAPILVADKFDRKGSEGDFAWMITQPMYQKDLFVYNDNAESYLTDYKQSQGGNAIIRPYKWEFPPRAFGIPTGTHGRGYTSLADRHDNREPPAQVVIDDALHQIWKLTQKHHYIRIHYSGTGKGGLGTGIFVVNEPVKNYILQGLRDLSQNSERLRERFIPLLVTVERYLALPLPFPLPLPFVASSSSKALVMIRSKLLAYLGQLSDTEGQRKVLKAVTTALQTHQRWSLHEMDELLQTFLQIAKFPATPFSPTLLKDAVQQAVQAIAVHATTTTTTRRPTISSQQVSLLWDLDPSLGEAAMASRNRLEGDQGRQLGLLQNLQAVMTVLIPSP